MSGDAAANRVADAPADIWVYRLLPTALWPYAQLARWDRPIGWWLLLWPCWWSVALAANDVPPQFRSTGGDDTFAVGSVIILLSSFFFFWLGAVMMRGAGCTYNDLVDADIDSLVARTASRPIPSGRVSKFRCILFLGLQALVGLFCLIALSLPGPGGFSLFAMGLGFASLAIVVVYPFAKRFTNWPQFVLGLAFSWGALMGWAVIHGKLSAPPLLLYAASIVWVIGYDTIYAHQDKEDDAIIGVRSTARLFGERTKPALVLLYSATLVLFGLALFMVQAGWPSYLGLAFGCGQMIWQIRSLDIDDADNCLRLFKSNTRFGWIIFSGLMLDLLV